MPRSQSSLAIVLRWRAYGESDKIATFLTAEFGKLTGIAKGAKNSRRRFANSLEPLARVRVHFRQKPTTTLAFLESCELLGSTASFSDPKRFAYASYLAELADHLTVEDDPIREIYDLLDEGLTALEGGPASTGLLRGFEIQLLSRAGFEPQLDRCVRCGRLWSASEPVHLSPKHGTVSCAACQSQEDGNVPVDSHLLGRLAALKVLPLAACREQALGSSSRDAGQVTGHLLAVHLTRPLRSVKLIGQLADVHPQPGAPTGVSSAAPGRFTTEGTEDR